MLKSGHCPFFSFPQKITAILLGIINQYSADKMRLPADDRENKSIRLFFSASFDPKTFAMNRIHELSNKFFR